MNKTNRSMIQPSTSGSIKNTFPAVLAFLLCIGLIVGGFLLVTSDDKEPSKEQWIKHTEKTNITTSNIARTLRITKWTVHLPDDLSSKDSVGIVKKKPDGNRTFVGTSGYQPGSTITVLLQEKNNRYIWTVSSDNQTTQSTTTLDQDEKSHLVLYSSNREGLQPGDFLIKGTGDAESGASNELQEGEFAFTVDIRKNDED